MSSSEHHNNYLLLHATVKAWACHHVSSCAWPAYSLSWKWCAESVMVMVLVKCSLCLFGKCQENIACYMETVVLQCLFLKGWFFPSIPFFPIDRMPRFGQGMQLLGQLVPATLGGGMKGGRLQAQAWERKWSKLRGFHVQNLVRVEWNE